MNKEIALWIHYFATCFTYVTANVGVCKRKDLTKTKALEEYDFCFTGFLN